MAVPDAAGVRIIPGRRSSPICPGCSRVVDWMNEQSPCPWMLSAQDALLLGGVVAGRNLDVELPEEKAKLALP